MRALKPFMIIACVAFSVGFVGYWALNRSSVREADPGSALQSAGETGGGDWNVPKSI